MSRVTLRVIEENAHTCEFWVWVELDGLTAATIEYDEDGEITQQDLSIDTAFLEKLHEWPNFIDHDHRGLDALRAWLDSL